jgi:hypothetical protein
MSEDLTAVRELTDEISSSRREASLARSWLAITERQRPRPQRTMTRRLMPVAAGLVAVMALATGWYFIASGGSHKALPADGQSLPIAQAWDAIIAAAQTAEPTTVPDGSIILVTQVGEGASMTVDGSQWTMMKQDRYSWFDPRGMAFLGFAQNGETFDATGAGAKNAEPTPTGPVGNGSLLSPTPQWITSLPTDPGALRDLLLAQSKDYAGDWSNRHGLWEALAELFDTADFAIPVNVRTAIYRVMAQEKGLEANLTIVDGRPMYVISRFERDDVQQLLFDPGTGRCVGRRSLFLGDAPGAPADRVMSWSIWEQHLVAKAGDKQ